MLHVTWLSISLTDELQPKSKLSIRNTIYPSSISGMNDIGSSSKFQVNLEKNDDGELNYLVAEILFGNEVIGKAPIEIENLSDGEKVVNTVRFFNLKGTKIGGGTVELLYSRARSGNIENIVDPLMIDESEINSNDSPAIVDKDVYDTDNSSEISNDDEVEDGSDVDALDDDMDNANFAKEPTNEEVAYELTPSFEENGEDALADSYGFEHEEEEEGEEEEEVELSSSSMYTSTQKSKLMPTHNSTLYTTTRYTDDTEQRGTTKTRLRNTLRQKKQVSETSRSIKLPDIEKKNIRKSRDLDNSSGPSFVTRIDQLVESRERNRREQQEKEIYENSLDKKVCPKCGTVQSFDQVQKRVKRCPNCRVPYGNATSWGNVRDSFLSRQMKYTKRREEIKSGKKSNTKPIPVPTVASEAFLERMEVARLKRAGRLEPLPKSEKPLQDASPKAKVSVKKSRGLPNDIALNFDSTVELENDPNDPIENARRIFCARVFPEAMSQT